jgi:membrane-associated phospholipid phosphatase
MHLDKKMSVRFASGIILFTVCVLLFGFLAHKFVGTRGETFDDDVFAFFAAYTTPFVFHFMKGLSFFGSHIFLIPAHCAILLVLLFKKRWQDAIVTSSMAAGGLLIMLLLKNYFHRDRPQLKLVEVVQSFSFPSGHTLSSFVFVSVLIYLLWENHWPRYQKNFVFFMLLLFSFLIGISRIVLRVHYASDVLAGFCAGISLVIFALWINSLIVKKYVDEQN